jgi:hypothetical protein
MNADPSRDFERESRDPDVITEARAAAAQGGVVTAIVVIMIGAALLLHQLGMLPHGFMPHIWPAVFIMAGLLMVANATSSPHSGFMYGVIGRANAGKRKVLTKDPTANVLIGVLLVAVGVVQELNARGITNIGWEVFWPLVIIGVGASMLWHHAHPPMTGDAKDLHAQYPFDMNFVFSGTDRCVFDKDFKGGRINAVFGGFKIDLLQTEIEGDVAVLEVNAVFGGGEIRVPETWTVELHGSGVFGAMEDKTRRYRPDPSQPRKTLIVKGAAVFGGIVIRN